MREHFLLDPEIVFLNHGSFGACPRPVFEAYQEWQRELERRPVEFLGRRSAALLEAARAELAAFLGSESSDLVFVTNTTTAVNAVARSLRLEPGDEVLATDQEYGALDNLWARRCQQAGARYRRQPLPLPLPEPEAVVEQLWAGVTGATRAIFLSHVTSTTALILPVAELCRRAREAGVLTIVDGAHAPGQLPVDLGQVGADLYIGNCHKWLCAPKGAAFMAVRPEHQGWLEAAVMSWGDCPEVAGHTDFDGYLGRSALARRHQWQGTRDIAAFLSVPAAIEFQREHRWAERRAGCHALALEARDRLNALTGLGPICGEAAFAQMVAVALPPCSAPWLKAALYDEHRIEVPITAQGDRQFVRVSVQVYNEPEDVEALIAALSALLSL